MRTEHLPRIVQRASPTRVIALIVAGAALAGIVSSSVTSADDHTPPARAAAVTGGLPSALTSGPPVFAKSGTWLTEFARRDPRALLRLARARCDRETGDFRCLFVKQERISGKLKPLEEIETRYRAEPLSVFMTWRSGVDQTKRALFIDSQDFVDGQGQRLARVEPAGALIRLVVTDIMVPIHDARARSVSRRAIDEFGFRSTFEILERVNELAAARNELDFRCEGEGTIDGRPTVILVRRLPLNGPGAPYPDAKLVLHLDQEWLLPTAVYSYVDLEGHELLGSYVFKQVDLNPGLSEDDFRF